MSADAEDVTQDALVEVFRGLAGFRGEAPFGAWVFAIVRRTLARHHGKRRPDEPLARAAGQPAEGPSPEQRAHARGLLRRLHAFLDRRHPDASQALELLCGRGLSAGEVAKRLCRTEDAVKAMVRRARADLHAGVFVAVRGAR